MTILRLVSELAFRARERERIELVEEHHARLLRARLLEHQRQVALALTDATSLRISRDADREMNSALHSLATARASMVLPQPGGPYSRIPPPAFLELREQSRIEERLDDLQPDRLLEIFHAGDVHEAGFVGGCRGPGNRDDVGAARALDHGELHGLARRNCRRWCAQPLELIERRRAAALPHQVVLRKRFCPPSAANKPRA